MKHDMDGPADTRMMNIAHEALRRDLRRLHSALTTAPYPSGERRTALGAHATWMMTFLHHHHETEDSGLYPMVRARIEMMPVVSASITQREWHKWDQDNNVKPKKLTQLAEEGNWLIDGLDPDRRKIVEAEVPAVPRYIVLYGFGPGYRKRAALRWGNAVTRG